jgi:hypothetical protein
MKGVPMKKVLLASVAAAAMAAILAPAPAEDLPKLSEFLTSCYRDNGSCVQKVKSYVDAAKNQKFICVPEDVSTREAASETLHWLRTEENYPASLREQPFDDGLYEATTKLYPCKTEATPPPPPVPPPTEPTPPATPPQP